MDGGGTALASGGGHKVPAPRPIPTPRRAPADEVADGRATLDGEVDCTGSRQVGSCSSEETLTSPSPERHLEASPPGLSPFPSVEDTAVDRWAPLDADDEEPACAPGGCTPEGCASVTGRALAVAKGPACPQGMTPVTMASACSRSAGSDAWSLAKCSTRSLGLRRLGLKWHPARHGH